MKNVKKFLCCLLIGALLLLSGLGAIGEEEQAPAAPKTEEEAAAEQAPAAPKTEDEAAEEQDPATSKTEEEVAAEQDPAMSKMNRALRKAVGRMQEGERRIVIITLYWDEEAHHETADEIFRTRYPEEYETWQIVEKSDSFEDAVIVYNADDPKDGPGPEVPYVPRVQVDDHLLQAAIEHKRAIERELYRELTNQVLGPFITWETTVFVSEYSPYAILRLTKEEILAVAAEEQVYQVQLVSDIRAKVENLNKPLAQITQELREAIENLQEGERLTVSAVLPDVDHEAVAAAFRAEYPEEYETYQIATASDFEDAVIFYDADPEKKDPASMEPDGGLVDDALLQAGIEHRRALYREAYRLSNEELLKDVLSEESRVFVSEYAPMAILNLTKEQIIALALSGNALSMDVFEDLPVENEDLALANQITRADYVRDTFGHTGSGIKIGMVEAEGIPNTSDTYLANAAIYIRPGDTGISAHATGVARILVGTDPTSAGCSGLAPDAELYCSQGSTISDDLVAIEWLISSGVNVINASMGSHQQAAYNFFEQWVDHIALQHSVHFVAAAGNRKNISDDPETPIYIYDDVTSPGNAYNAITVGGLDDHGDDEVEDFTISDFSCFEDWQGGTVHPEKPNLVAPSVGIFSASGTSFAAPQVAGTIAQLCSMNTALKTKQAAMGAILMASAAEKVEAVGTGAKGDLFQSSVRIPGEYGFVCTQLSDKEGAGILDSRWARGVVHYGHFWTQTIQPGSFPYSKTVAINAANNTVSRVAIFWLKRNTIPAGTSHTDLVSPTMLPIANLTLCVFGPNGNLLGVSTAANGNFEIVQFVPPTTGTYTIQISGSGSVSDTQIVGIALW